VELLTVNRRRELFFGHHEVGRQKGHGSYRFESLLERELRCQPCLFVFVHKSLLAFSAPSGE
jgi:hypothetical protein